MARLSAAETDRINMHIGAKNNSDLARKYAEQHHCEVLRSWHAAGRHREQVTGCPDCKQCHVAWCDIPEVHDHHERGCCQKATQ